MTTLDSIMDVTKEADMPLWMREERCMYCDQTTHHKTGLFKKLRKLFL